MSHDAEPRTNTNVWVYFLLAGFVAAAAAAPALHLLNDRHRFEPTGSMSTDPAVVAKERRDRTRGDWWSSAEQGGLIGAVFGVVFAVAAGLQAGSSGRAPFGGLLGGGIGFALGMIGRNLLRDFSLYAISNDWRGLHVNAASQALLWGGAIVGAALGVWAARGFSRLGGTMALGTFVGGAIACFAIPIVGETALPLDYSNTLPFEHWGQSILSALVAGLCIGIGAAFAARGPQGGSSI
jgi:hypothetical protein